MDCGGCGKANRPGARFCGGCGAPLAVRCSSCGVELEPDLTFCDSCGARVGADAEAATPIADTAVRKTVTVLFADLGGSTSFGERTDAELAREVMARYHAILQEVVDTHGGTVAKFTGDGLMAVFGIPEIAEDDAVRAVRAGIEAQRRFPAFAAEVTDRHGEHLTFRVGINTGEIVIGDGDADLVGDALNVAARLEKECRPGHVLVGGETWRLCRDVLAFEPLGEVTVAGRAAPVAIYEVATEAAVPEPVAPFVGRQAEMERVRGALGRAIADRSAQVVTVLGSPGVGKTRLAREIAAVAAADTGAVTFEIRCDRAGDATFAPIAQLIREAAGLDDETTADDARERIAELVAADFERDRVADILAGVYGAAAARSVEETFWAIRRLVESLAATRPVVIVIDDIQWAEPKLLDLLEHLAEWIDRAAVLLLCLARPELRDVRPSLVEPGRRVADVLALDGLDQAATAQLAAGLLGTERLPTGLLERLPASTDGNPLFVRELVRMLVHDDVVRRRSDGEWELTIDADAVEVPPTIQSLLATRVERLPADERHVLELASVVGAEFSLGALRALAAAHAAVPSLLESMRRKELVEPTGTYWGDEPVHRFHHVLIRDAAYRRLLKTTRAELHQRVGEWTDATAATLIGEHDTAIAYHYEQAYRYRSELGTLTADTDRLGVRAAELLSAAAQRALGRDDLGSAGTLARRALDVLPAYETARRAELLIVACECLLASGDALAGAPLVEELRTLAGPEPKLGAWAACFEAQLIGLTAPHSLLDANATATVAAETLATLGDGPGEAKAHQVRAGILARLGRIGEAKAVLDLALGAARAADDQRRVTLVLGAAPIAALFGPSPVARAGGDCLDVVRLLRITTASPSVEATSIRCQAVLEALRGRFDVARTMLASARASLEELGLRHGLLETDLFAGMVELIAGNPGAAIAPLRAAYEGLGTLGVGADAGLAAALLARALLDQGDVDDADRAATASEELAGQNLKTAIAWRIARAEVLATRGDIVTALAHAEAAVEIASATDLILDHADACVALAQLRERADDAAGAQRARADALRLYEAKGATVPAERLAGIDGSNRTATTPSASSAAGGAPVVTFVADASARTPRAENAASAVLARLIAIPRVEETRLLYDDGYVWADRRRAVSAPTTTGFDEMLVSVQAFIDVGFRSPAIEPLAVRGDRLFLSRNTFRTEDEREIAVVGVAEVGPTGLLTYTAWYDEDDLVTAVDDLDARFLAGEGAEHTDLFRPLFTMQQRHRALDWEGYRAILADDFVIVDHRTVGLPVVDRDGFLDFLRAYVQNEPDWVTVVSKLHRVGRALLGTSVTRTTTTDAFPFEWAMHGISVINRAGRIERYEWFADDDFDRALARLDELGASDPRTPLAENRATRVQARLFDLFLRARVVEARALFVDSYVHIDRRSGVSMPPLRIDDALDNWRVMTDLGVVSIACEPIAVRGDRLFVSHVSYHFDRGDMIELLMLGEIDEGGLLSAGIYFDDGDLDAAMDELETRYLASEGAAHAEVLSAAHAFDRALRSEQVDAIQDRLAPGFEYVDHRALGWGQGDGDYFLSGTGSAGAAGLTRTAVITRNIHVVGRVLLVVGSTARVTKQGSDYEWTDAIVVAVDTSDRISRVETFALDDFDDALARLDELGAEVPTWPPYLDNTALRAITSGENIAARSSFTDGVTLDDRRAGVSLGQLQGSEAVVRTSETMDELFGPTTLEPVATRGERLVLVKTRAVAESGFELVSYMVFETTEVGQISAMVSFDETDLDAAFAELNARYFAREGSSHTDVLRAGRRFLRASASDDLDAVRALLSPEFEVVDHRPLGYGTGDCDYFVDALRARTQVASDARPLFLALRTQLNALLSVGISRSITDEGSEYERFDCVLLTLGDSGDISRMEWFPAERYADARRRLEELGAPSADAIPPYLDNPVVRLVRKTLELMERGDWEAVSELGGTAENIERIDRRTGMSAAPLHGAEEFGLNAFAFFDVFETIEGEPVAIRGDRLALIRLHCGQPDGLQLRLLALYECDEHGRMVFEADHDDDELTAALAELDRRYYASEAAPHLENLRVVGGFNNASVGNDFDAMRAVLAPNFRFVDHQRLGFGQGDRDAYFDVCRTRKQVATDPDTMFVTMRVEHNVLLTAQVSTTTTAEGSEYEWATCSVVELDESRRISALEWYDLDRFADASARFRELGAPNAAAPIGNAASRLVQRYSAAWAPDRLDDLREFVAHQMVRVDHRSIVAAPDSNDYEGFVESTRSFADAGYTVMTMVPLAVRGDRLCLFLNTHRNDAGFTSQYLVTGEIDGDGRIVRAENFDETALDAALDRLEAQYVAGEGAADEYMIRRIGDMVRAERRGDAAAWDALFAPDVTVEITPDAECVPATLTIRNHAALMYVEHSGRGTYRVARLAAGLFADLEVFDAADSAAADARFKELGAETRTPHVDNAAIRALVAAAWRASFDPASDELEMYHADCVLIDRRRSVNAGEVTGRDDVAASINSGIAVFGGLTFDAIAVRGEHLVLSTWRYEQEGGFNTAGLSVLEISEQKLRVIISFDDGDLAATVVELEARHRVIVGEAYGPADAFVAALPTGPLCAKAYTAENVALTVWADRTYSVIELDDEGRATSTEPFDEHQWTDALTRFDQLAATRRS